MIKAEKLRSLLNIGNQDIITQEHIDSYNQHELEKAYEAEVLSKRNYVLRKISRLLGPVIPNIKSYPDNDLAQNFIESILTIEGFIENLDEIESILGSNQFENRQISTALNLIEELSSLSVNEIDFNPISLDDIEPEVTETFTQVNTVNTDSETEVSVIKVRKKNTLKRKQTNQKSNRKPIKPKSENLIEELSSLSLNEIDFNPISLDSIEPEVTETLTQVNKVPTESETELSVIKERTKKHTPNRKQTNQKSKRKPIEQKSKNRIQTIPEPKRSILDLVSLGIVSTVTALLVGDIVGKVYNMFGEKTESKQIARRVLTPEGVLNRNKFYQLAQLPEYKLGRLDSLLHYVETTSDSQVQKLSINLIVNYVNNQIRLETGSRLNTIQIHFQSLNQSDIESYSTTYTLDTNSSFHVEAFVTGYVYLTVFHPTSINYRIKN